MKNENIILNQKMRNLSSDDFLLLRDPETRQLVEKHLTDDPVELAFRLKCGREQARLVCQQVKYLQRAKNKLPFYYNARCIIPPLSYEQCSSETAAMGKKYSGKLCIDLTCGLGVDSFYFSKAFGKVITVERDPVLADIAQENFRKLGAENIVVKNDSAEYFLSGYSGQRADLIYVDPARRNEGERVFLLEECSPNVVGLVPLLLKKSKQVLIKLSPLYDIEEGLRVFHPYVSKAEIVSVKGEVKELLIELTEKPEKTEIIVNLSGEKHFSFRPEQLSTQGFSTMGDIDSAAYLLIPDAAFYKGRLTQALFSEYYPDFEIYSPEQNGFGFAEEYPKEFPGRVFRITETMEYQPKRLKKLLKEQGIKRINILRRNFPYKSEEIKRVLGISEGGTEWFAFTEINGKPLVLKVDKV